MASLPSLLKNFASFLQNNQVSFTNGLLILFTVGGEQIFRFAAFRCPCTHPEAMIYACSYIFGPAIVLGILGVMVNNLTWRLCHGFVYNSERCNYTCWERIEHFFAIIARAGIVPSAWLFITFLDGNYFVCMLSNEPCADIKESKENQYLQTISQIISWGFLVIVVIIASVVIWLVRCFDSVSYMQNRYAVLYRELEGTRLEESMKKSADERAQLNIERFMSHPQLKKEDWDLISKAPDHRLKKLHQQQSSPEYTPLHKWSCNKVQIV